MGRAEQLAQPVDAERDHFGRRLDPLLEEELGDGLAHAPDAQQRRELVRLAAELDALLVGREDRRLIKYQSAINQVLLGD